MDIVFDFESMGIDIESKCSFCGRTVKNGGDICTYCDKSKIFLEKMHVNISKIKKKMFILISDVDRLIPLPKKNQQVRIRTQVSLNMLALVLAILKKHGTIDFLVISSYSFDRNSVSIILDLVKSRKIKAFSLLMSDTYAFRYKEMYAELKEQMIQIKESGVNVSLCFAVNHMKITLCKCGNDFYQIEGSMNYSVNNLCEQVSIENCKETYQNDFELLNNIIPNIKNSALERVC